jgi:hypothetical protein
MSSPVILIFLPRSLSANINGMGQTRSLSLIPPADARIQAGQSYGFCKRKYPAVEEGSAVEGRNATFRDPAVIKGTPALLHGPSTEEADSRTCTDGGAGQERR